MLEIENVFFFAVLFEQMRTLNAVLMTQATLSGSDQTVRMKALPCDTVASNR